MGKEKFVLMRESSEQLMELKNQQAAAVGHAE